MSKRNRDEEIAVTEDLANVADPGPAPADHEAIEEVTRRETRVYTAREAYQKISTILKRTPADARARVLAAAHQVIELG